MWRAGFGLSGLAGALMAASSALAQGGGDVAPAPTPQMPQLAPATPPGAAATDPAPVDGLSDGQALGPEPLQNPLQLPFVTLNQARLFSQSQYGARLLAELEARQADLAAENRSLEAGLERKEGELTAQRRTLGAEEFRRLADAFNGEVERHRSEQAEKERAIYQAHERNRALFQDLANQALAGLLRERGAYAIIAEEAIVIGFRGLDITSDAVARLDALVGDGSALPQLRPDQAPEPGGDDGSIPGGSPGGLPGNIGDRAPDQGENPDPAPERGNQTTDRTSD